MNKTAIFKIIQCVAFCAVTTSGLHAQGAPAAPPATLPGGPAQPGGQGRGGQGRGGPQARPGPPAPVPPEVAIPRPTQSEVDQMNASLRKFIATSPDKELLTKYESMLSIQLPRPNPAIAPVQTVPRSSQRHDPFVETAKTGGFDILFAGDSITDWWQQPGARGGGADVQQKYFGEVKVANFAIAGDTTQGVLWGLQNGEGQGHKPKAVMLMIGTNNAGGSSGPEIAEGVGAIVYQLRKDFPDAKIMLLAIFPRGSNASDPMRVKNEVANKIIAKLHDGKNVFYTNINDKFTNPEGGLIGFRPDNLHPNAEGYEIWASAVADTLKNWIK